jgi:hypothetical protein
MIVEDCSLMAYGVHAIGAGLIAPCVAWAIHKMIGLEWSMNADGVLDAMVGFVEAGILTYIVCQGVIR